MTALTLSIANVLEGLSDGQTEARPFELADAVTAFESAASRTRQGFRLGLDRTIAHPFGPMPARRLLFFRGLDNLVHAWDLARATGLNEELNREAVTACTTAIEPIVLLLPATGMYATPIERSASASAQDRLLGLVGRGLE